MQTSHVSCAWWEEEPYWLWDTGSKVKVNFGTLCIRTCGHNTGTTVLAQSLSNFICNLWMMRGGTLLILGHRVKGQGQLWHSLYKALWAQYRLQFKSNYNQTSHVGCVWWGDEPYWFWVMVNFAPPPCEGMSRFVLSSCKFDPAYEMVHLSTFWLFFAFKFVLSHIIEYRLDTGNMWVYLDEISWCVTFPCDPDLDFFWSRSQTW